MTLFAQCYCPCQCGPSVTQCHQHSPATSNEDCGFHRVSLSALELQDVSQRLSKPRKLDTELKGTNGHWRLDIWTNKKDLYIWAES